MISIEQYLLTSALECRRRFEHAPHPFGTDITVGDTMIMHSNVVMPAILNKEFFFFLKYNVISINYHETNYDCSE